jgi:hypothetical protein
VWDRTPADGGGDVWGCWLEIYQGDPQDLDELEIQLAFRLAGED